jgi:hypothetical protein
LGGFFVAGTAVAILLYWRKKRGRQLDNGSSKIKKEEVEMVALVPSITPDILPNEIKIGSLIGSGAFGAVTALKGLFLNILLGIYWEMGRY